MMMAERMAFSTGVPLEPMYLAPGTGEVGMAGVPGAVGAPGAAGVDVGVFACGVAGA